MVMQPPFVAEEGELILEKGSIAKKNRLLTDGAVGVEHRRHKGKPHTLAKVEAEEILDEMGLFGNGGHAADERVIN